MAIFVVDASVALAWCFEDEVGSWGDGLLVTSRPGRGHCPAAGIAERASR